MLKDEHQLFDYERARMQEEKKKGRLATVLAREVGVCVCVRMSRHMLSLSL